MKILRMKTIGSMRISALRVAALTLLFNGLALPLHAQTFPDKPIRILVSVPAGAGPDVEARRFAAQLSIELGQSVLVENKPGAAQMLAMEALTKAPADGYTLATGTPSNLSANPRLFDRPMYNVEKDIAPISLLAEHPWVLYVNANVPANNLAEFIALAKAKPGKLTYASTGIGSLLHLSGEWFQKQTATKLTHIPYGATNWLPDLLAGTVDVVLYPLIGMVDHVKSGKLRAIAISSNQRSALLPEVPTFAEANLAQFSVRAWFGLVAPAGTPELVLKRLSEASAKAAHPLAFKEFMASNGAASVGSTPTEFGNYLKSEQARWRGVITDANIKLE
jgi:tripartite-type tricarboxylate transporter receptor subunit TctC